MMMTQSLRFKSCAILGLILFLSSSQAGAIGLLQAYQEALKNDPLHRAAKADNRAGQEYEAIGRSALLPSMQYSYAISKNKGEYIAPNFFGQKTESDLDYKSTSRGFNLKQPIFNLEAYTRFEQGVVQTKLSNAQFDSRSRDLMIRVVSAYADAKYSEDQLNLYTAQRDAYLEQKSLNARLFEKGEGTKTDMLETQAKLDVAEAMVLEAVDNMITAKNTLAGMIGIEVTSLDRLVDDFNPVNLFPSDFESWKTIAMNENSDLVASRLSVETAELEIKKSLSGHAPRLDFNASYSRGDSETVTTRNQATDLRTIGIQLTIPIYSGGYVNAVSKQAVANRDRARAELDANTNKIMVELRKQFNALNSSTAKINALKNSVNSSKSLVEATKQSIKGGTRINLDLLNAEQQLVGTKRDFASARYNYLISYLRLRVAAGNLQEDDLRIVAGYFVPQ